MILDENLVIEAEQEKITLTDKEIFTKIWLSPRLVFRFVHQNSYGKYVPMLLVLAGIGSTIDRSISSGTGNNLELWAVLAIAIGVGAVLGWVSYYIYSALMSWMGKWLGGTCDTSSLLRVVAYAQIPSVAALFIVFAQIGVFRNELFQSFLPAATNLPLLVFYYITYGLNALLGIWTFVLLIIGVSEVQKMSIGRAVVNVLLPVLVILIPLSVVAFILGDLFA